MKTGFGYFSKITQPQPGAYFAEFKVGPFDNPSTAEAMEKLFRQGLINTMQEFAKSPDVASLTMIEVRK